MCAASAQTESTSPFFEQEALEQVVRAPDHRFLLFALFDGEDGRHRIVLNVHGVHGFAHLVSCQDARSAEWLRRNDSPGRRQGRVDRPRSAESRFSPGMSAAVTTVNSLQSILRSKPMRADEPARNGAAHRGPMPHAFALDIVDVARCAPQFVHTFLAGNGGANDAGFRMRAHGWGNAQIALRVEA